LTIVLRPYLPTHLNSKQCTILTSIVLSNTFHLFALIPLYSVTRRLFPLKPSLATVTCILHSFTPAGAFLLSGNTESLFAFLSFLGMALFHRDHRLLPAIVWSAASSVRSNGLLWTGFFAWDAVNTIIETRRSEIARSAARVVNLGVCAVISLGGFAWWQYSAWEQYCSSDPAPWCSSLLPLIYSHVQSKYWYIPASQD